MICGAPTILAVKELMMMMMMMMTLMHRTETNTTNHNQNDFILFHFTAVLSHWNFFHGKFGLLTPGKANSDRVALPNLLCMLSVLLFP